MFDHDRFTNLKVTLIDIEAKHKTMQTPTGVGHCFVLSHHFAHRGDWVIVIHLVFVFLLAAA